MFKNRFIDWTLARQLRALSILRRGEKTLTVISYAMYEGLHWKVFANTL